MPSFTLLHDKSLPAGAAAGGRGGAAAPSAAGPSAAPVALCPSMDLLAYAAGDAVHVVVRGR
jgi:hypothetical protein